ncbi:hypothetical protein SUGI_1106260 [Cryptomeria japonica]|uniref:E3 ubiquitin-protein ligase RING1-like n=1 Tax=Cryptomeria japonica TaxID=3369 RepID=UPI0024146D48|nr:E3 ubiquitin-protein ligase RING1-like [Cryptomeria japonica]GLJ52035.1 hypothetical protein SUGI_1106260 [Cryptomeria japonica]
MAAVMSSQYWCHQCEQTIVPILGDDLCCPRCNDGFVEELEAPEQRQAEQQEQQSPVERMDPRFMALLSGGSFRAQLEGSSDERAARMLVLEQPPVMMQLMHALGSAMAELHLSEEAEQEENGGSGVVVVDPMGVPLFMLQGSNTGVSTSPLVSGTLGDYFLGQGMEALLQRLAENDPNHYGTPPAAKEAVEALTVVKITEEHLKCELSSECAVCKDEFTVGEETRQLPCKHLYHGDCIFPWLKMHSSCPVCRFQMPSEEGSGKAQSEENTSEGENGNGGSNDGNDGNGWFRISMPFNIIGNLVSSALRHGNNNNSDQQGNNGNNEA